MTEPRVDGAPHTGHSTPMVGNTAVAAALDRLAATVREQHQSMAEQYSGLRGDLEHFGKPPPAAAPTVGTAELHLVAAEAAARRLAERRLREAAADASAREQTIQELRETLERTKLDAAEELRRLTFQLRLTQDELADAKRQLDEQADEMVVLRQREGEANRAAEAAKDDLEALSETMATAAAREVRLQAQLDQRDAELASRDAELAELAAALERERQASARPSLSASLRSEVSDADTSASASVAADPSVVSGKPKRKARLGLPSLMRRRPSASAAAPATALAAATAATTTLATTATVAGAVAGAGAAETAASASAAVTASVTAVVAASVTASVAADDPRLEALMAKVAAEPRLLGTTRSDAARVLAEQGGHVGKAFNELQLDERRIERLDPAVHQAPSGGLATASATAKAASRFSFGLGKGKN